MALGKNSRRFVLLQEPGCAHQVRSRVLLTSYLDPGRDELSTFSEKAKGSHKVLFSGILSHYRAFWVMLLLSLALLASFPLPSQLFPQFSQCSSFPVCKKSHKRLQAKRAKSLAINKQNLALFKRNL